MAGGFNFIEQVCIYQINQQIYIEALKNCMVPSGDMPIVQNKSPNNFQK